MTHGLIGLKQAIIYMTQEQFYWRRRVCEAISIQSHNNTTYIASWGLKLSSSCLPSLALPSCLLIQQSPSSNSILHATPLIFGPLYLSLNNLMHFTTLLDRIFRCITSWRRLTGRNALCFVFFQLLCWVPKKIATITVVKLAWLGSVKTANHFKIEYKTSFWYKMTFFIIFI